MYTVLRPPSFVIARMNTVTIFCNRQGSHLLISGKYSRIKPFRVQTNRIDIYMVTVVAPYFKFLNQRYISANTPKSNEPAIYLSQRYIPNNVTLKTQKRVAFYDRIMHKGDGFSAKTLGKKLFHCQNDCSSHGPAGQFRLLESTLSVFTLTQNA